MLTGAKNKFTVDKWDISYALFPSIFLGTDTIKTYP